MGRSRTVTLTLEPDFRWAVEAWARSTAHTTSEWEAAFQRLEAALGESAQHLSSLCAQIVAAGLAPAHLVTLAELAARDDRPMPTRGLRVTREQIEYALKWEGRVIQANERDHRAPVAKYALREERS